MASWSGIQAFHLRKLTKAPVPAGHHLHDIPECHTWWDGEPIADFFWSVSKGWGVCYNNQGLTTCCPCPIKDLISEIIFCWVV